MEGGACQGALGGAQAGTAWGTENGSGPGMEKRGKSLRREEGVCGGPRRGLADSVSDLAAVSGTPEECSPQAAMFEHVSTSPVKAMSTPYSVSSVMGDFLM